jgi:hypothetical protein
MGTIIAQAGGVGRILAMRGSPDTIADAMSVLYDLIEEKGEEKRVSSDRMAHQLDDLSSLCMGNDDTWYLSIAARVNGDEDAVYE